jgi:hypothetical protein
MKEASIKKPHALGFQQYDLLETEGWLPGVAGRDDGSRLWKCGYRGCIGTLYPTPK